MSVGGRHRPLEILRIRMIGIGNSDAETPAGPEPTMAVTKSEAHLVWTQVLKDMLCEQIVSKPTIEQVLPVVFFQDVKMWKVR